MVSRTLAGALGLKGDWDLGEDNWKAENDINLLMLSVFAGRQVKSRLSATPGAPVEGDVHIFKADHPTQANKIAVYDEGAWSYFTPPNGFKFYSVADDAEYQYKTATGWAVVATGGGGGGSANPDHLFPGGVFTLPRAADFAIVKDAAVTAAITDTTRGVDIAVTGAGGVDRNLMLEKTPAGATYTIKALVVCNTRMRRYMICGLYARNSATDKILATGIGQTNSGAAATGFRTTRWNSRTSFNSEPQIVYGVPTSFQPFWIKLEVDATNIMFSISGDGEFWEEEYRETKAAWVGTPDRAGIWFGVNQFEGAGAGYIQHMHVLAFSIA